MQKTQLSARLKNFFSNKLNWCSLIVLLVGVVALLFSMFLETISYAVILAMFTLIAAENFLTRIAALEDIRERLENMGTLKATGPNYVELKIREELPSLQKIVSEADEEVFFSSVNLAQIVTNCGFLKTCNLKKIRLLAMNVDDPELRKTYEQLRGRDLVGSSPAEVFKQLKGCEHIQMRTINVLTTTHFMAKDMKLKSGYIRAEHLLNNQENNDLPSIELVSTHENWYPIYRDLLESLWERAIPWEQ